MKVVSVEEAVAMISDGASIMIGGFMGVGTPERVLDELVRQRKSNLFVIANRVVIGILDAVEKPSQSVGLTLLAARIGAIAQAGNIIALHRKRMSMPSYSESVAAALTILAFISAARSSKVGLARTIGVYGLMPAFLTHA
jgi:hypothetical protein